mmetsp:Transcript_74682/g.218812  ORF Transcript_74682/g.218812 Transcript_74682/m.218812 type:complete len:283 (+) Transcript_74682:559-1407(+)
MCEHWQHDRHAEREVREEDLAQPRKPRENEAVGQGVHLERKLCHPQHLLVRHVEDPGGRRARLEVVSMEEVQDGVQRLSLHFLTKLDWSTRRRLTHAARQHGAEVGAPCRQDAPIGAEDPAFSTCNEFHVDPGATCTRPVHAPHVRAECRLEAVGRVRREDAEGHGENEEHHSTVRGHAIRLDSARVNTSKLQRGNLEGLQVHSAEPVVALADVCEATGQDRSLQVREAGVRAEAVSPARGLRMAGDALDGALRVVPPVDARLRREVYMAVLAGGEVAVGLE